MHIRATLLILALAAPPALAAPEFYLGGTVGRADTEYENAGGGDALRVYGGVRFPGHWGIELSAFDLGEIRIADRGVRYELGLEGYSLAATLNMRPAGAEGLGLFLKGGVHHTESRLEGFGLPEEGDTTSLLFGFGADYAFGRNLAVRAEIEFLPGVEDFSTTGDTTVSVFHIGGELRF